MFRFSRLRRVAAAVSVLAGLAAFSFANGPEGLVNDPRPFLYVRGADGDAPLGWIDPGASATVVPAPLLSRSERVRRAQEGADGFRVRVYAGERGFAGFDGVTIEAVRHSVDAQIVIGGETPWLVGPPRLPLSVVRPGSDVELTPELARLDANCVAGGELAIATPEESFPRWLVLIADEAARPDEEWRVRMRVPDREEDVMSAVIPRAPRRALVLDAPRTAFGLVLGNARVDQLFFADARGIEHLDKRALPQRTTARGRAKVERVASWRGEGELYPVLGAVERIVEVSAGGSAASVNSAAPAVTNTGAAGSPSTSAPGSAPTSASAPASAAPSVPGLAAGELADFAFEPLPDPGEGYTWTLLVRVANRAPASDATVAVDAAAPRADADATVARGPANPHALFRDVAREAGLEFVHMEGPDLELDIRPTMGPGAAWGDVDGDGRVDLFLVQGAGRAGSRAPQSKLYKNAGDGRFVDATRESGLVLRGAGMGALFFDADGDRDLDLFVANYGANALYLNDGHGVFSDVSAACMPSEDRWHASVVAADYDGDGDLDLYVTSYIVYDEASMPAPEELGRYQREDPIAMLPYAFAGEKKTLLVNEGLVPVGDSTDRVPRFVDRTEELGLTDAGGRGMQALFWDYDRDGDQDLYLANDVSPNRLWRNEGGGKFKDVSFSAGVDDPRGSMGLAAGDVDGDGDEDLAITNWQLEANALYVNNLVAHRSARSRVAAFRDQAVDAGIAGPSVGVTKWGVELADFDDDGDLDLFYANGYTSPDYESTGICVGQPCHYFVNDGEGKFRAAFEELGAGADLALPARAAVACDYDQDGDLDLVVTANNGRARLFENTLAPRKTTGKHWLGVRLLGKGGNTQAIGAEVTVKIGDKLLRRSMRAGTSYLCGNAPELHFGLGDAQKIDDLTVRWPAGQESRYVVEKIDTFVTLQE